MLKVHHLERSRSIRVIWLMEELGLDYELVRYQRHPVTIRAPESLKAIHPMGKAPVLVDGATVVAESGAIIEYVVETHGHRLGAAPGTPERAAYLEWMHFAEAGAVFPIMITLLGAWTGGMGEGLAGFIGPEVVLVLDRITAAIEASGYLLKSGFSAADIQMSYVLGSARMGGLLKDRPALLAYLERLESRPAYRKAIERGGPAYAMDEI